MAAMLRSGLTAILCLVSYYMHVTEIIIRSVSLNDDSPHCDRFLGWEFIVHFKPSRRDKKTAGQPSWKGRN